MKQFRQKFAILFFIGILLVMFQNFTFLSNQNTGDEIVLSVPVLDSQVIIKSSNVTMAGAISSLTFRGVEYIDSYDHGRELQSATSFNYLGECFNPTEAGGRYNSHGHLPSSSILEDYKITSTSLYTKTNMAFWLRPNEDYKKLCGITGRNGLPAYSRAVNSTILSGHRLEKIVTVGVGNLPNVLDYQVTFHIPSLPNTLNDRKQIQVEVLTGYMPYNFGYFWGYNPKSRELIRISDGPGDQPHFPIIMATSDGKHAMGILSLDPPSTDPEISNSSYGRFRFRPEKRGINTGGGFIGQVLDDALEFGASVVGRELPRDLLGTVKWNVVRRITGDKAVPGSYSYRIYVPFGTLTEVIDAMNALYQKQPNIPLSYSKSTSMRKFLRCQNKSDSFITGWESEAAMADYDCENKSPAEPKTVFEFYPQAVNDMVPLYRCRVDSKYADHFISRNENCEGQNVEGIYGYVYPKERPLHSAVVRYYNRLNGHHLQILDGDIATLEAYNKAYAVFGSSYTREGILGWVKDSSVNIVGEIEDITNQSENFHVRGWACVTRYEQPITVQFFVGAPIGRRIRIGTSTANILASSKAEQNLLDKKCKTKGIARKFDFIIPKGVVEKHVGQEVYAYGMWPTEIYKGGLGLAPYINVFRIPNYMK